MKCKEIITDTPKCILSVLRAQGTCMMVDTNVVPPQTPSLDLSGYFKAGEERENEREERHGRNLEINL